MTLLRTGVGAMSSRRISVRTLRGRSVEEHETMAAPRVEQREQRCGPDASKLVSTQK